jgi:hypothetical protein
MKQILLGYDIRFQPKEDQEKFWTQERRNMFLIRPEILTPLSVDKSVWPSAFIYDNSFAYVEKSNLIYVGNPSFHQEAIGLWEDYANMVKFFEEQSKQEKRSIQPVSITLLANKTFKDDSWWNAVLDTPIILDAPNRDWIFLGYDVADRDFISGLSNCGFEKKEVARLRSKWASKLNNYGLFSVVSDALKFRVLSNRRCREHSPFFVYGLFQIKMKTSDSMLEQG